MAGVLVGLTVVEHPRNPATGFCGKLFADFGAVVYRIAAAGEEERGYDESRGLAPFLDCDKVILRPGDEAAGTALRTAAVIIGGAADRPDQVAIEISDYAPSGDEYRHGTSLTAHAAAGYLFRNGDPDREPLRGLTLQPYAQAALGAFVGGLAALLEVDRTGRGQTVSVAVADALATIQEWAIVRYTHGGTIQGRLGNRYAVVHPTATYATADGHIALTILDTARSDLLLALAGHPEAVGDPRLAGFIGRSVHQAEYDAMIVPWLASKPRQEVLDELAEARIPVAAVLTLDEVLTHPHFAERGTFREVSVDGRVVRVPASAVRWTEGAQGSTRLPGQRQDDSEGPLAGLRVLDLTAGWSGPHGCRLLGDLGAQVVKVEPPWARGTEPPDEEFIRESGFYMNNDSTSRHWLTMGVHNTWAFNKQSVALRLDDERGRETLDRLLAWADVVVDNYSTQAWTKLGLDFASLSEANPAIVAVTMPGYGRSGPAKNRVSYGNQIEAENGAVSLMGYPDRGPHMSWDAWPDPCGGFYATADALAGLWRRNRTSRGQRFEVSQAETALSFIGDEFVEYGRAGTQRPLLGNRHPEWAPHGVYRCAGTDRWVAVACTTNEAWRGLCTAIGRPDLAERSELATAEGRHAAADEVDAAVSAWTVVRDFEEAANALQSAGVAAYPAVDSRDMALDRGLHERGAILDVYGEPLPGFAFDLSLTPNRVRLPVPDIGEHNEAVLLDAGLTAEEVTGLREAGVLGGPPDGD